MGREASARGRWQDRTGEVKALLESTEIILRGGICARIPRTTISAIQIQEATLIVATQGGTLSLDLGAAEAEKWAAILRKPPPGLAEKLGVSPQSQAFVVGRLADAALAAALEGSMAPSQGQAAQMIAEIHTRAELDHARTIAAANTAKPIWIVHEKGPAATLKDSEIRVVLRAHSLIDTKSTAVSAAMTATLYRPRR